MKEFINKISADKLTYRGFIISLFLAFITIAYIIFNYRNLPPFIPVFDQLPWGDQRLTQTPGIFIPVIIFAFIFVFNIIFTSVIYSKNPLIARIVASTTLLVAILNFLFIIRTILVIL